MNGREGKGREEKGREGKGREGKRREEKRRDYTFWRQFNEKQIHEQGHEQIHE